MPCPECGEIATLVGTEPHSENSRLHVLTFECTGGHVTTTTFPN
jgi:hypothetical protein